MKLADRIVKLFEGKSSGNKIKQSESYTSISSLLDFIDAYNDLDQSVQFQLFSLSVKDYENLDPDAVALIKKELGSIFDSIYNACSDYEKWLDKNKN